MKRTKRVRKNQNNSKQLNGRPKLDVPFDKIDELSQLHCTPQEIIAYLRVFDMGISQDTLDRRFKEKFGTTFAAYVDQKQSALGKKRLRELQWKAAENGNATILIWLGKQYLDQMEPVQRTELTGKDGGPLELQRQYKLVQEIINNPEVARKHFAEEWRERFANNKSSKPELGQSDR